MSIAVIPARGGSKGIRKKNIVSFLETPLIAYTIEQAKASDRVTDVYVSTDDKEIANVSERWGADIIDRPDRIAGDEASTESALLHAIKELTRCGNRPEMLTLLQCTSPLRREFDIDATVKLVAEEGYDSALTACEDHKFYWTVSEETAEPVNYDPRERKRRQDMESHYQENGSIYVMRTSLLEETGCRLGGQIGIHEMPETLSFEIDSYEDLTITENIGRVVDFYAGDAV